MQQVAAREHFGFSRERARPLEIRAKDKLKSALSGLTAEVAPETTPAMQ